ncbi:MAG TPA: TylF/MycF/NovP-related O-methyltransferase [Candidatus Limnocylindria bacterium]|nr:TylF/MycF/NovP-related O-methyltransferase [Candidatus Limnocylindria bacterium]
MKRLVKATPRRIMRRLRLARGPDGEFPPDFGAEEIAIIRLVQPYTMTSPERLFALIEAVRYVARNRIPGAVVECGVWKGGSMMAVAETLKRLGQLETDLYLYDTFRGMTDPGAEDVAYTGESAADQFRPSWLAASLAQVEAALATIGYPAARIHLVPGDVEETIPGSAPDVISLLRLDTDWYASTRHELVHLYPRLAPGGVLIVDDYGHWEGARRAVDEYVAENRIRLLLNRIDYTGRIAVKG